MVLTKYLDNPKKFGDYKLQGILELMDNIFFDRAKTSDGRYFGRVTSFWHKTKIMITQPPV